MDVAWNDVFIRHDIIKEFFQDHFGENESVLLLDALRTKAETGIGVAYRMSNDMNDFFNKVEKQYGAFRTLEFERGETGRYGFTYSGNIPSRKTEVNN